MASLDFACDMLNMSFEIISIEGNIGSGKSHLFNILKTYFTEVNHRSPMEKFHFVDEPVSEWMNIRDETQENKNILELFYGDKDKYSFVFQTTAYITRLQNLKKVIDDIITNRKKSIENKSCSDINEIHVKHVIISERSLETDKNVFAKMLHDDGHINEIEYTSYNYWFANFIANYGTHRIIYLQVDPEISYERTKNRNRSGEEAIPLEYLARCHSYHEEWIQSVGDNKRVYVFDASTHLDTDAGAITKAHREYMNGPVRFIYS